VAGDPTLAKPSGLAGLGTMIPYLVLADLQNTALSAILTFSDRVIYPSYSAVPRLWEISALDDHATAGVIIWISGSVGFSYLSPG
jgi:hypothetical protein